MRQRCFKPLTPPLLKSPDFIGKVVSMKSNCFYSLLMATLLVSKLLLSTGEDSHNKLDVPGFRPESKLADKFIANLGSSRIAVLPTLIRTHEGTSCSEASQKVKTYFHFCLIPTTKYLSKPS